jgi:hypothetical protein
MHWRTFERLTARHDELVGKSLADMVQRLRLAQGRLDGLRRHLPAEG